MSGQFFRWEISGKSESAFTLSKKSIRFIVNSREKTPFADSISLQNPSTSYSNRSLSKIFSSKTFTRSTIVDFITMSIQVSHRAHIVKYYHYSCCLDSLVDPLSAHLFSVNFLDAPRDKSRALITHYAIDFCTTFRSTVSSGKYYVQKRQQHFPAAKSKA